MIRLREGVELCIGSEIDGSKWYLVDLITQSEFSINNSAAAYLKGKKYDGFSSDQEKELDHFLSVNKLRYGDEPLNGCKSGFSLNALLFYKRILIKPDNLLSRHLNVLGLAFSKTAYVTWIILLLAAFITVMGQNEGFLSYTNSYSGSTGQIILAIVLIKVWHELGHAIAAKLAGATVKGIGILLIFGMPLAMTDVAFLSSKSRFDRMRVAIAGIYFESWISLICILIWAGLSDSELRNTVHFIAVVSFTLTLTINLIPLLKFDGYQLLCAAFNWHTLYEDATDQLRSFLYLLINKKQPSVHALSSPAKRFALSCFGFSILIWRIFLPFGIMKGINIWFPGNHLMQAISILPVFSLLIMPALNEAKMIYKAEPHSPSKLIQIGWLSFFLCCVFYLTVPLNHLRYALGAITNDHIIVKSPYDGSLAKIKASGLVQQNEMVASIVSEEIDTQASNVLSNRVLIESTGAQYDAEIQHNKWSLNESSLQILIHQQTGGELTSSSGGYWNAADPRDIVSKGTVLGSVDLQQHSQISIFVPSHAQAPAHRQFSILKSNGGIETITAHKIDGHVHRDLLKDWIPLSDNSVIEYRKTIAYTPTEMVIEASYKQKYSILAAWFGKYKASVFG